MTATPPPAGGPVALKALVSGLSQPLDIEQPADGSNRFFIVEQGGTIRIVQNNQLAAQPFLDISSKVTDSNEMGLLGMTFHPGFPQDRRFYINYVRTVAGQIQSVIAEYQLSAGNPDFSDPASERILLVVNQVGNFTNHKAGQLAFGPDGLLYFGLGDGGSGGDPFGNGQNTQTLLGKLMRINVDSTSVGLPYAIPADNPFANGGGRPEIYAIGFRNPWRFSFDGPTGRLILADVGQNAFEEIDIVQRGGNYGWNTMEGMHCFQPASGCDMTGLSLPITEIPHPDATAAIGGFIYHGTLLPGRQGQYIFGDLNGKIRMLQPDNPGISSLLLDSGLTISSFGRDQDGELYVLDYANGRMFQMVPM